MPVSRGHGNPSWIRDDTILALDLLLRTYPRIPGKSSKPVRELSKLLNSLPIHAPENRTSKFQDAGGPR